MTNKIERFLLSLLLGLSVLLGLSFWLNIMFGFNLFYAAHWAELSRLQAEQTPISNGFYMSIVIAILIFTLGLLVIHVPHIKSKLSEKQKNDTQQPLVQNVQEPAVHQQSPQITNTEQKTEPVIPIQQPSIPVSRPPRLNLPTNMAQIVAQKHEQKSVPTQPQQTRTNDSENPYNSTLSQMFIEKGYSVKPNPRIAGFTPNLFAIAPNEILWIGAVDQDITQLQTAIDKLQSLFEETLEDIPISINAFMLDSTNSQQSNDSITVLNSFEQLKEFISKLPSVSTDDSDNLDKSNFDAYSEYIDTIIQYLKSIGS